MNSSSPSASVSCGLLASALSVMIFVSPSEGRVVSPRGGSGSKSSKTVMLNGLPAAQQTIANRERAEFQSMLLKYAARCALREGQDLEGPADDAGHRPRFPGSLGMAPEWRDGTCDGACQEKVSSCLIALINRTGKHVQVSMVSAAPAMAAALAPNDNDIGFPHQEGTFFGNVFSGEAYACRGRDVQKAAQVKRFCALQPESCTGLSEFVDAGRCEDACEMRCSRLSNGSERCAAVACTDPDGRRWKFPITTYLRNQIEAGNADKLDGTRVSADGAIEPFAKLGAARYEQVDFGAGNNGVKAFVARVASQRTGGRIEVWLDGRRRLGVLNVGNTGGVDQDESIPLKADGVSGMHSVVLKLTGAGKIGHLSTIEFR